MTADLVRRLRSKQETADFENGRWSSFPIRNEAADRIEALETELADLKKEREAVDALRKHEGTPTPEIMAWAEKTFMQAEIDDLKTQINILVNVGREVWSALQTNSDYTTAILSLADVLALHPPLTDRPALEATAAPSREAELVKALEDIALLDEADGHELKARHAFEAVAIATKTLGKHPSTITAERFARATLAKARGAP